MSFLSFIKIIKQGANDLALKPSTSSLSLGFIHNAFQLLKSNAFNILLRNLGEKFINNF